MQCKNYSYQLRFDTVAAKYTLPRFIQLKCSYFALLTQEVYAHILDDVGGFCCGSMQHSFIKIMQKQESLLI